MAEMGEEDGEVEEEEEHDNQLPTNLTDCFKATTSQSERTTRIPIKYT